MSSTVSSSASLKSQFLIHVRQLVDDNRLRVDTTIGRRAVRSLLPVVTESADALDVTVSQKKWFRLQPLGRLRVVVTDKPAPLATSDIQKLAADASSGPVRGVPLTLVIGSMSGFEPTAHEQAERRADRTIILVEPNGAGGWNVYGPTETKALNDLFDPESDEQKRTRFFREIEPRKSDVSGPGVGADTLTAMTKLPMVWVENELRTYASTNGLLAKRVSGTLTLLSRDNPLASKTEGPLA